MPRPRSRHARGHRASLARHFSAVVYCGSLVVLALAVGLAIESVLHVQNVLLVFLPVILLAAVRYGFWTSSWVAVVSVLVTSFFFAEPRYSFAVSEPGNVWALAIFVAAAGLTSSVAAQARQRAEALRRTEVLAETDRLKTALLTSISHDLRTPLASILGNVTSLRQYGHLYDAETRAEMLGLAEEETLRLSRFVDNLLHMTRIDAGALKPSLELIDLADVVGSALKRVEKALSGHVVRVDIDETVPMIPLDFVLAEHVLANLLENAAKYSPPGTTIDVSAVADKDRVLLRVRDRGPGIPARDRERIFERFFRLDTPDRRPAGAGLGLAICRGFVEAMGGTIGVADRAPGDGAELTVAFRANRSDAVPG